MEDLTNTLKFPFIYNSCITIYTNANNNYKNKNNTVTISESVYKGSWSGSWSF